MRVQRLVMPDGTESWTVLDDGGDPVPAVEAFLAHLQALDRSPATVRTYAMSLRLWLVFLAGLGVAVEEATVDHVSRFVAWLRSPAENVTVLDGGTGRCGPATVNRHMAALFSCYDYQARNGVLAVTEMVVHLAFQRALEQQLGQLAQKPPWPVSFSPPARARSVSSRSSLTRHFCHAAGAEQLVDRAEVVHAAQRLNWLELPAGCRVPGLGEDA